MTSLKEYLKDLKEQTIITGEVTENDIRWNHKYHKHSIDMCHCEPLGSACETEA